MVVKHKSGFVITKLLGISNRNVQKKMILNQIEYQSNIIGKRENLEVIRLTDGSK